MKIKESKQSLDFYTDNLIIMFYYAARRDSLGYDKTVFERVGIIVGGHQISFYTPIQKMPKNPYKVLEKNRHKILYVLFDK